MSRRNELAIADCETCMRNTPKAQRQALGCGYEAPIERDRLTLWRPPGGQHGYQGSDPTMCAGYTSTLPEVYEATIAHAHWSKGNGAIAFGGEPLTDDILSAIIVVESAQNAVANWKMVPFNEGGGGK